MNLCITGFLPGDNEDDSLKFELDLDSSYDDKIVELLGHKNLNAMAAGEWDLTTDQVNSISEIIGQKLPTDLDLFIGVFA